MWQLLLTLLASMLVLVLLQRMQINKTIQHLKMKRLCRQMLLQLKTTKLKVMLTLKWRNQWTQMKVKKILNGQLSRMGSKQRRAKVNSTLTSRLKYRSLILNLEHLELPQNQKLQPH